MPRLPETMAVLRERDYRLPLTAPGRSVLGDRVGVVAHAHGPERLSGDWWDDAFRRDYWRCRTDAGELLVFLDRAAAAPAWYVQGWYD